MSKYAPKNYINFEKCFTNEKYCYINIPKNGSTTLRSLLKTKRDTFDNNKGKLVFTVLRDPMTRIISSFFECSKLRGDGPKDITIKSKFVYSKLDVIP